MFLFSIYPLSTVKGEAIIKQKTEYYYSLVDDGSIAQQNTTSYETARNSTWGNITGGWSFEDGWHFQHSIIGQYKVPILGIYQVARGFLFFEINIPDTANITSASLNLYIKFDNSYKDFNITIQNGQPTYPHRPLIGTDYDLSHYSENGGGKNTSEISGDWFSIPLNETGRGWIDKSGITKLCLRSSKDIDNTAPTTAEYIQYFTHEKGEGYKPYLSVTYNYFAEEEPPASGGDTENGEPTSPIDIPKITVPKIPVWGYYLILGSVCVVALASILTKRPKSKHGPNGTKIKKTQKRLPKRNKKGRFT